MTMPSIDLRLNGDGALQELKGAPIQHFTSFMMTGLRDGMASGKPSLMFAQKLADGSSVCLETSGVLLEASLRALKIRWGLDPDKSIESQV